MLYGELLVKKNLATEREVEVALETQKKSRMPVGQIAVSMDMVFREDAEKIHSFQADSGRLFGESGVHLGYLSRGQVDSLLNIQKRLYLPIGKIISMEKESWKVN